MKIFDSLDLTVPGAVLGNHGVWLPERGIKIPFQWGGRLAKLSRPGERTWPLEQMVDEVAILRALAAKNMTPPVGDFVFFKNVISTYSGAWHWDPCGAYGYEIGDARKLPKGQFDIARMRELPIDGSEAAWNDALKESNVVNGYLIDARRSGQDILHWKGPGERVLPPFQSSVDVEELVARVHRDCQFPAGERGMAYQDFWAGRGLRRGQRRVVERSDLFGFSPAAHESVLDVGCQSGSFLQNAWWRMNGGITETRVLDRGGRLVGVDINSQYIDCARDLARSCSQNICFRQMDVKSEYLAFLNWIRAYFPRGIDHFLLLSMEKHLGDDLMLRLIDDVGARHTYVETNAVAKDSGEGPPPTAPTKKIVIDIQKRGGKLVGSSRDRNLRWLCRIDR